MLKIISKIILPLIFWGIFTGVVFIMPYPDSLTQANFSQIILFFAPLFLALLFTLIFLLKTFVNSTVISSGLIFLLILKGLDTLNLVSGSLIFISVALLLSYFKKAKRNLTKLPKIPKLTHIRK
ncbi:MAG: hypothetical protein ACD_38C00003G0001 [uncultured bacterium]|uniref:Uncharacterized protein n=1 Tax=Candidatus Daviesbacteria bacterium GW2011_GWC2_40_12 TaxID=1618431 RepID=A0A0G0QPJ3_9BACT|nr:MAG: hypothetical protein ACD_38C00003G0001 [uncultured bacterium]KKR16974.1 MAG: hypothetical protein UT45_C0003G0004 [Candidatus Daviesbacteria bacterium GW2011_GWA2_39_33]KKR25419.1 MAG: hypothetical protein UT54_C0002G0002 [Candidatus Daviesbacteria bacterium GW2011_GWB1_39_5]KKR42038.1 MAG: hypothetical protein UT77_C0004G0022 [Candidatus Daviesbacteria bacterium GW2011_GWC2_40_12]OGE20806.1 MAG: hypothetical protein A2778_06060 [Candidatus Daviesbacteria bacterium RIFCSPHIGHO2_01_FULL_